jgi:hypothetical protein
MKSWSDNLIKLSREHLNYSGSRVKSINGDFGLLNIDYDNNIYTIIISGSSKTMTFNTVDEIINSGWVVD